MTRHARRMGLLAAGPVSPALASLPALAEQLGLVASASLQVASRLANSLKAGRGCAPKELDSCDLILLSGPAESIPCLLDITLESGLHWQGKTVVLFDTFQESSDLAALQALGAQTASLDPQPGGAQHRFVGEGDAGALRQLRQWMKANRCQITCLAPGKKALYRAGVLMVREFLAPLLAAAETCFEASGVAPAEAAQLAERNMQQAMRQWSRAGRKCWDGRLGVADEGEIDRMTKAMEALPEELQEYFSQHGTMAMTWMGSNPEWFVQRCNRAVALGAKAARMG